MTGLVVILALTACAGFASAAGTVIVATLILHDLILRVRRMAFEHAPKPPDELAERVATIELTIGEIRTEVQRAAERAEDAKAAALFKGGRRS